MNFVKSLLISLFVFSSVAIAAPVNVNTASVEDIAASLKGVGPAKALAISEHCQKVACQKPEDLLAVKGIGEKTLEKIASDLKFQDE